MSLVGGSSSPDVLFAADNLLRADPKFDEKAIKVLDVEVPIMTMLAAREGRMNTRESWARRERLVVRLGGPEERSCRFRVTFVVEGKMDEAQKAAFNEEQREHGDLYATPGTTGEYRYDLAPRFMGWLVHLFDRVERPEASRRRSHYVVRTILDSYVHLPNTCARLWRSPRRRLMIGSILHGSQVITDVNHRNHDLGYHVCVPATAYHRYPSGIGFAISIDVARTLAVLQRFRRTLVPPVVFANDDVTMGMYFNFLDIQWVDDYNAFNHLIQAINPQGKLSSDELDWDAWCTKFGGAMMVAHLHDLRLIPIRTADARIMSDRCRRLAAGATAV